MQEDRKDNLEISLKDLIEIFKRNKRTFFLTSGTFFTVGIIIFLFFLSPMYEVTATAELRSSESSPMLSDPMSFLLSSAGGNENSVDIDLLNSRKVLNKVLTKGNLQFVAKQRSNNMFMYFFKKIFGNGTVTSHIVFLKASNKFEEGEITAGSEKFTIFSKGKKAVCNWGASCMLDGEEIILKKIGEIPENTDYLYSYTDAYTCRKNITKSLVVFPSDTSNLLNLSFVHESPEMGAYILDLIVKSYVEVKEEWQNDDENVKQDYINAVLDRLQKDIDEKSSRMILFQKEKETIVPEMQVEELIKKQEILKATVEEVNLKISLVKEAISGIKENPETPLIVPMIFEDLSFQEALKNHNKLVFTKNELLKNMTSEHPS